MYSMGFPGGSVLKSLPAVQETWEMWVQSPGWEDPQEEARQPIPVPLPGESHGQRSLEGYSPWGHKGLGQLSKRTHTHTRAHTHTHTRILYLSVSFYYYYFGSAMQLAES